MEGEGSEGLYLLKPFILFVLQLHKSVAVHFVHQPSTLTSSLVLCVEQNMAVTIPTIVLTHHVGNSDVWPFKP